MKLNLGCGKDYRPGWVNVDASRQVKADFYFDLRKKFPFKDNQFEFILAQDVLEHFTKEEGLRFLRECWRVLRSKGKIKIRTSNIYQIFKQFGEDEEVLIHFLYGNTSKEGKWGAHKFGYTEKTLRKTFKLLGFKVESLVLKTTNLVCKAQKAALPRPKVKLLLIDQDAAAIGGAEIYFANLVRVFRKKKIPVLAYTNLPLFKERLKKAGAETHLVPTRMDVIGGWRGLVKFFFQIPWALAYYGYLLWKVKQTKEVNIILIGGFSDKLIVTPLARLFNLPVVWIEFGPLRKIFKRNLFVPKILYRLVKNLPKAVVVPSQATFVSLIKDARVSLAKIEKIPCGIEVFSREELKKFKKKAPAQKKKLGLEGKTVIGNVSRVVKDKGQEYLLDAFPIVKKKFSNTALIFVGDGPYRKSLEEKARRMGVKDVHFLGFRHDLYQFYALMDVFVFPTVFDFEGFGLVAVEAMMMKKSVVASEIGPVPEVVENRKTGLLVKAGEAKELARGIMELLENPKAASLMGKRGREKVKKMFDIKTSADKILEVLSQALILESE